MNKREKYKSERQDLRRKLSWFLIDIEHWQRYNPEALKGKEGYKLEVIKEKIKSLQIEVQGYYIFKAGEIQKRVDVDQERKDRKKEYLDTLLYYLFSLYLLFLLGLLETIS